MTTIPNTPSTGDEFTNELTGVTYRYDGEKWVAVSAPGDGALSDLEDRVTEGEEKQQEIIDAIQGLEGLKIERRRYRISTDSVSPGEVFVDSLIIGQTSLLFFNSREDINGEAPPDDIYKPGDQITFRNNTDKVTFIITESQQFGTPWRYRVQALSFEGAFEEDEEFIVTFGVSTEALSTRVAVGEARQEQLTTTVDNALEVQEDLVAKVDALEGNVVDDVWEFENRAATPRPGEFTVLNGLDVATTFADVTTLVLSTESKLGNVYGFDAVAVGDVIRLAESPESAAEFRIRQKGTDGTFFVDVIRSSGDPIDARNYDFVFLSAFDPAGLATIDYVDSQDERRLLKSGDVMGGDLLFKRGANPTSLVIQPSFEPDNSNTLIYAANSGALRFRSSIDEGTSGRNTHIVVGKTDEGTPLTALYHVQYPQEPTWGANKQYVDDKVGDIDLSGYLPLTGGVLTGGLEIKNKQFTVSNSIGDEMFYVQSNGFASSRDMIRFTRTDNGSIIQGRNVTNTTVVDIKNNGDYQFNGLGDLRGDVRIRNEKSLIVRDNFANNVGYFKADSGTQCTLAAYNGKTLNIKNLNAPSDNLDAVPRIYVDNALAPYALKTDVDDAITADATHLRTSGGTLSGNLTLSGGGLYTNSIIKSTRDTGYAFQVKPGDGSASSYIHTNGNAVFANVSVNNAPSDENDLTNKNYVDTKIAEIEIPEVPDTSDFLTKSTSQTILEPADKLIHSIFTFDKNQGDALVRFSCAGTKLSELYYPSSSTTQFSVVEGKEFKVVTQPVNGREQQVFKTYSDGQIRIEHLKEPTQDHHAVTKAYCDIKYPGLRFKWNSGSAVESGKFAYYNDGGIRLRVSNTSQDYQWNDGGLTDDYSFSEGHRFTIYEKQSDGSLKIMRTGTYNRTDYHSDDLLIRVSSQRTSGSFNTSSDYYITLSGIF